MPYHEGTLSKKEEGKEKLKEFCEVKIECRESHLRCGPRSTRMVEGQVKRIELEYEGYIDNILAHEVDGRRG